VTLRVKFAAFHSKMQGFAAVAQIHKFCESCNGYEKFTARI